MADPVIAQNPAKAAPSFRRRKAVRREPARAFASALAEAPEQRQRGEQARKIALRTDRKIIFIDPAEANAIEAQGNSALLRTATHSYLLRQSISSLARRLEEYGFVRIHRSTVVNEAYVEETRVLESGEMLLRLRGTDTEYSVSRRYRSALKSIASVWL